MKFVANERTMQGTGASRRLRNAGRVPAIVYGDDAQPQLIEINHNALWQAIQKEAFHSTVLDMELDGKDSKVLLRDLQIHPYRQQILHADFQRVSATKKLHMRVPLHYTGAETSKAVMVDNCLVDRLVNELEVRCLASQLPERIEVDLSGLAQGDTVTVADVKLPEGVEPALRGHKAEDVVLVVVVERAEEEVDEVVAAPAAADAAATDAAAAPAAGAAAAPAAGAAAPAAAPKAKK